MDVKQIVRLLPSFKNKPHDIKIGFQYKGKQFIMRIISRGYTEEVWPCVYVQTSFGWEGEFVKGFEITWSRPLEGVGDNRIYSGIDFKHTYFLIASDEEKEKYLQEAIEVLAKLEEE